MFFFNVIVGTEVIADLEGTELASLETARLAAVEDARSLMSSAILDGWDISERAVQIADTDGNLLLTVRFADAIKPE